MKVAITGGNGHIGFAIIQELLSRSYEVKALVHHQSEALQKLPIELVKGSLLNEASLHTFINDCDYLIHCAAIISINGDPNGIVQQTNIEGLRNLLEVASQHPLKKIIHLSSVHAYKHSPKDEPFNENRPFVDDTAYAYDRSKRDGQLLCKEFVSKGLPIVVVNPSAVFGPPNYASCKQNNAFIAMSKGKIPFVFKGGYNWVDVRDVATSIVNALDLGQVGESYILGGKYYTLKELSTIVSKVNQRKRICIEVPIGLVKIFLPFIQFYYKIAKQDPSVTKESIEILESGNKHISSEKASAILGHRSRPIEESMKDLLTWHEMNLQK
jgi:dihydroflavonol-4-reductase